MSADPSYSGPSIRRAPQWTIPTTQQPTVAIMQGLSPGQSVPAPQVSGGTFTGAFSFASALALLATPGGASIDASGATAVVANGGTVNFPNFSGLILVNDTTTGHVALFLCGTGLTTAVANAGGTAGTLTYSGGQYVWTNTSGGTSTVAFFAIKTRSAP